MQEINFLLPKLVQYFLFTRTISVELSTYLMKSALARDFARPEAEFFAGPKKHL